MRSINHPAEMLAMELQALPRPKYMVEASKLSARPLAGIPRQF